MQSLPHQHAVNEWYDIEKIKLTGLIIFFVAIDAAKLIEPALSPDVLMNQKQAWQQQQQFKSVLYESRRHRFWRHSIVRRVST